jgi:YHS domain-containing protein
VTKKENLGFIMHLKIIIIIASLLLMNCNSTSSPTTSPSSSSEENSSSSYFTTHNSSSSNQIQNTSSSLSSSATSSSITFSSSSENQSEVCNEWNSNGEGVVAKGYDVVAYFNNSPTLGTSSIKVDFNSGVFHFSTEANKTTFLENPEKYAPQFGGYCARAMASGSKVDINPEAYEVYDQKLYLQASSGALSSWQSGRAGFITSAQNNWSNLCIYTP